GELLAPLASRIMLIPLKSERSLPPEKLAPVCRHANPDADVVICSSLAEALEGAAQDKALVMTGSLYLVGEALELLGASPVPGVEERPLKEWGAQPLTLNREV